MIRQTLTTRVCASCGSGLSADVHGNRKRCEPCSAEHELERARQKASDWYYANTKRAHAAAKSWRAENMTTERARAYRTTWLAKPGNKAKVQAWISAWCKANPERMHAYYKRWYVENMDALREVSRDRARLYAKSDFTFEDWLVTLEVFGHRCAYCMRDDLKLTMDHVIAITCGGEHSVENIVPSCQPCNSAKGNRPVFLMVAKAA